ncbi:MAG: metallophosphoesterase [Deltaproteobacteria bacterium]|nr:metallophosphoesterase [Deltaproteobacteria bacterium]
MDGKKLFISDVHLGAGRFGVKKVDYPYEWDWLSAKETKNFVAFLNFLRTKYPEKIGEIVFIGDIFDNWVFPHDQDPPTMEELIAQPKNKDVVKALNDLASNYPVFYVPGNHDMHATREFMSEHFEKITYCPEQFVDGRQLAEHGHRYALFNAPPYFSEHFYGLPLGYFISRVEATRKGKTNKGGRNYRTYLDDFLEVLGSATLPQCVLEAVLEETGLGDDAEFKVKTKSGDLVTISAAQVKQRYKDLYDDWPEKVVSTPRAVFAELDRLAPIADKLCKNGKHKVCIFGHSHKAEIDKDTWFVDDRIYANTGYWCGSQCTFVETDKLETENAYLVRLMQWQYSGKIKQLDKEKLN